MSFQPESLIDHIRVAASESNSYIRQSDGIFYESDTVPLPTLSEGKVNRILLYPGAFNPPHLGHLRLLEAAPKHSTLKYAAAIILPYEESSLAKKLQPDDVALTIEERAAIWRAGLPENLDPIVWPSMMGYKALEDFVAELKVSVQPYAELEVDVLFGPDNIYGNDVANPVRFDWLCVTNMVTSNATREFWAKPHGEDVPKKVYGCREWELASEEEGWKVWKAGKNNCEEDVALIFVDSPYPPAGMSSTKIRELLMSCGEGEEGLAKADKDPLWQQIVGGEAFAAFLRGRLQ